MYLGVKEVKPIDNYKLILTFGNNEVKIFDMIPYLDKMIFQELKYKKYLKYNLSIKNYILKKLIILPHNFYNKTIGFIKKFIIIF